MNREKNRQMIAIIIVACIVFMAICLVFLRAPFARVGIGDTETEVRELMGIPDSESTFVNSGLVWGSGNG